MSTHVAPCKNKKCGCQVGEALGDLNDTNLQEKERNTYNVHRVPPLDIDPAVADPENLDARFYVSGLERCSH
jgi:hypothetical protein